MYKRLNECYAPYEPGMWNSNSNLTQSHNCYSYFLDDINNDLSHIYKQYSHNVLRHFHRYYHHKNVRIHQ